MKKFIHRLKVKAVSRTATKNYIKACKLANKRYEESRHDQQFVISSPKNELELIVCTSNEFIEMRKSLDIKSKELTLSMLKRGCWFRTPNKKGLDRLDPRDLIKRKCTYVRMCLDARGLLEN